MDTEDSLRKLYHIAIDPQKPLNKRIQAINELYASRLEVKGCAHGPLYHAGTSFAFRAIRGFSEEDLIALMRSDDPFLRVEAASRIFPNPSFGRELREEAMEVLLLAEGAISPHGFHGSILAIDALARMDSGDFLIMLINAVLDERSRLIVLNVLSDPKIENSPLWNVELASFLVSRLITGLFEAPTHMGLYSAMKMYSSMFRLPLNIRLGVLAAEQLAFSAGNIGCFIGHCSFDYDAKHRRIIRVRSRETFSPRAIKAAEGRRITEPKDRDRALRAERIRAA